MRSSEPQPTSRSRRASSAAPPPRIPNSRLAKSRYFSLGRRFLGPAAPDTREVSRFYGERRPHKQAKAERRFRPDRHTERVKERFRDMVGGVTEQEYQARLSAGSGREES